MGEPSRGWICMGDVRQGVTCVECRGSCGRGRRAACGRPPPHVTCGSSAARRTCRAARAARRTPHQGPPLTDDGLPSAAAPPASSRRGPPQGTLPRATRSGDRVPDLVHGLRAAADGLGLGPVLLCFVLFSFCFALFRFVSRPAGRQGRGGHRGTPSSIVLTTYY